MADDPKQKLLGWLFDQEVPSLLKTGAAFVAGHLTSGNLPAILAHWGITVDPHKFSSSLETWGAGIIAMLLAHYGVKAMTPVAPAQAPVTPPAPPQA